MFDWLFRKKKNSIWNFLKRKFDKRDKRVFIPYYYDDWRRIFRKAKIITIKDSKNRIKKDERFTVLVGNYYKNNLINAKVDLAIFDWTVSKARKAELEFIEKKLNDDGFVVVRIRFPTIKIHKILKWIDEIFDSSFIYGKCLPDMNVIYEVIVIGSKHKRKSL